MRVVTGWFRQVFWPPSYDGSCPVCRAELPKGAHVCNECKSLVRSPMAVVYVAALLTSLPVLGGAAVYLYNDHSKRVEEREHLEIAAAEAAKNAASALEGVVGLAGAIFRARYHVANACSPYFRDADFFEPRAAESCAPQLMYAVYELDQQIVALAYQLDVIPAISHETRRRFDSLNTHYWSQASPTHPAVGYRQRILDALHGVRDFEDQLPLRDCGPLGMNGLDATACEKSMQRLRSAALTHVQRQIDATLCSLVSDIRTLRRLAQETTVAHDSPLGKRLLDIEISRACKDKLRDTASDYVYQ